MKALLWLLKKLYRIPGGIRFLASIIKLTKLRKDLARNINLVLPKANGRLLAGKLITNTCYTILEMLNISSFRSKDWQKIAQISGLDNVAAAFKEGKGVIILAIHAGNYELVPNLLARHGYRMNSILRANDEKIFEVVNNWRKVGGVNLINVLAENMFQASSDSLGRNEGVYILADTGAAESRHELVDFLGHKVKVATGWLTLAQRTGCEVVPVISYKNGPVNKIVFFHPYQVNRENRETVKIKLLKLFEKHLSVHPEQWNIFFNSYETERLLGMRE